MFENKVKDLAKKKQLKKILMPYLRCQNLASD